MAGDEGRGIAQQALSIPYQATYKQLEGEDKLLLNYRLHSRPPGRFSWVAIIFSEWSFKINQSNKEAYVQHNT